MLNQAQSDWEHDHVFGQDQRRRGERRTIIVMIVTAATMVAEIVSGLAFGSMALLADGLHMGSHAVAFAITLVAYMCERRYAGDRRFSFGTGKFNALGGYTGAILLFGFAVFMVWESFGRFLNPVEINFNPAIGVAVLGLIVNAASAWILGGDHDLGHGHDHDHGDHDDSDHNLRAAYLHVLADALTSLLAIFALLAGKYVGLGWLDPLMGIIGAGLVTSWSWGLIRDSGALLLDRQAPEQMRQTVRRSVAGEDDATCIADLHVWAIGPDIYAAELVIVAPSPESPETYKQRIPDQLDVVHATVEVHRCQFPEHEEISPRSVIAGEATV